MPCLGTFGIATTVSLLQHALYRSDRYLRICRTIHPLTTAFSWLCVLLRGDHGFCCFGNDDLWFSARVMTAAGSLLLSCIPWTMVYNTIYAVQDIRNDVKVGFKFPIVRHQRRRPKLFVQAASVKVTLLDCIGITLKAMAFCFISTCFSTGLLMGTMT